MKRVGLIMVALALIVVFSGATGCDNQSPEESGFNMILKYGVTAKNELDTFQGTYTKDMVSDPPVTTELCLSEEEMDRIYQKMVEIDFFSYPDEFSVTPSPGENIGMVTPYSSYYFKVVYNSRVKELRWDDEITNPDAKADKLRELINLIRGIIESKDEYKKLPKPRSGYL